MSSALLVLVVLGLLCCGRCAAQIEDVRLANSSLGKHAGRVEVLYNGTWGTICNDGWLRRTTSVVCRELGFSRYMCAAVDPSTFGVGSGPVWLSQLTCPSDSTSLNQCSYTGFGNDTCTHSDDTAVICQDNSIMPVPVITQAESTTARSVTLRWNISRVPPLLHAISFRIFYTAVGSSRRSNTYHTTVNQTTLEFSYILTSPFIYPNTTYDIYLRADGEYKWCNNRVLYGNVSKRTIVTTVSSVPPSTLPIRLVSPDPSSLSFIGRLEVYHDGQWGSVCDDYFRQEEADVACYSLNYTRGAVCYATRGISQGTGRIWLDNVDCSGQDRLEDCTHLGWGVENCVHSDEVGVVCRPDDTSDVLPLPTHFAVSNTSTSAIILVWEPPSNTNLKLQIRYKAATSNSYRYRTVFASSSTYTLTGLQSETNYSIQVRSGFFLSSEYGGNCPRNLFGKFSDHLLALTVSEAPTAPPGSFHISVLNSTALEATWALPPVRKLNGRVRGFKIFIKKAGASESVIKVGPDVRAYIIGGLAPETAYTISMLVYTVADGPRSVHLTVLTPATGSFVTISQFGIYGNNLEVVKRGRYSRGFNVLCTSSVQNSTVYWKFSNGSRVGHSNIRLREGIFQNGTAVLQIGSARNPPWYLQYCNGGVYTCVVNSPGGAVHERNFTLLIGYYIPRPSPPYIISKGSTWIQLGWDQDCDGGYQIHSYDLRMKQSLSYYYTTVATTSDTVFIVEDLSPNTEYLFVLSGYSEYAGKYGRTSDNASVTTLPTGPSPPRNVTATITSTRQVLLTWNAPASPNGVVSLYIAYASTAPSQDYYSEIDLPNGTVSKVFHAYDRSGIMELKKTALYYKFQMSTVSYIGGEPVEGDLSSVGPESIVFVPNPGLPEIRDLVIDSVANTSVKLSWTYPLHLEDAIVAYKVSYSGDVQWTSPNRVFVHFQDSNELTTTSTSITISPLVPSTIYVFKVSVITLEGQGAESMEMTETSSAYGERLAFFQLRIQNIKSCEHWHGEDKLSQIKMFAASTFQSLCQCGVTASYISQGEFSCRGGLAQQIVYRARVSGTATRSASDLVALLVRWVKNEHSSVVVDKFHYSVDTTCDANLDSIHAPDCPLPTLPPTDASSQTPRPDTSSFPTDISSSSTSTPYHDTPTSETVTFLQTDPQAASNQVGISSAALGGLSVGVFIAGLLVALLIAVLVATIFFAMKKRNKHSVTNDLSQLVNETSSNRSSVFSMSAEEEPTTTEKL